MEEINELAFLFAAEVAADRQELLVGPARIRRDLLAVLGHLELHLARRPLGRRHFCRLHLDGALDFLEFFGNGEGLGSLGAGYGACYRPPVS